MSHFITFIVKNKTFVWLLKCKTKESCNLLLATAKQSINFSAFPLVVPLVISFPSGNLTLYCLLSLQVMILYRFISGDSKTLFSPVRLSGDRIWNCLSE